MTAVWCLTCGKVHDFPVPKFAVGQKVKLVSDAGFHHHDKVGQITTITGIAAIMVEPCDKVEYETDLGFGNIMERRLEAV